MELLDSYKTEYVWLLALHLVPVLNVASLNLLYRFFFSQMLIWICATDSTSLFMREASTSYSDRLWFFVSLSRDVTRTSMSTVSFLSQLNAEIPLTYDLNGFNARINRHLLTVGSFLWLFCLAQSESKSKRRCYMAKNRASFWWLVVPKKEAICIILCQIVTVWCFR